MINRKENLEFLLNLIKQSLNIKHIIYLDNLNMHLDQSWT